jgi:excisionase family DNA binding protein
MARPRVANEANVRLWTKGTVAELLCISTRTVERMISAGELPTVHVRGALRIPAQAVLDYVEAARQDPTAPA